MSPPDPFRARRMLRILFHMARADFLERARRYSFLIMLGLVLYLGYAVNAGQIILRLDTYRGIFNSAWVGSMMALVVNFFLGWFGFYLIKNAISRDYETGVGQIIATTPLSRPAYLLGKWLSNFAVLAIMVVILLVFALAMQLLQREEPQIHLWALTAPFLFVALPFMGLIAAVAVLFESIRWLRGGLGNLIYFFVFISGMAVLAITVGPKVPMMDWIGFGLFSHSMGDAARAVYPGYGSGFSLGLVPPVDIKTFYWAGIAWTLPVILTRLTTLVFSIGIALLGSLFFDRFDTSRWNATSKDQPHARRKGRIASEPEGPDPEPVAAGSQTAERPVSATSLTPLPADRFHFRFGAMLVAEFRILLKGLSWWWYGVALGLMIACAASPLEIVQKALLPAALIWPVLLWSGMGCREARHNTRQLVFSTPQPLLRQLPAIWLSGFGIAVIMGAGAAMNIGLHGDTISLLSLLVGMLFIPSLALMLGAWTGSSRAFEIIYMLLWYLGPVNKFALVDYTMHWQVYLPLSLLLVLLAVIGRKRQLSS